MTRIAIVGAGFTGTLLAIQLIRLHKANGFTFPLTIKLIEKKPFLGKGLAYSTNCVRHLLNIPAYDMSAFPDQSDHFFEWVSQKYNATTPNTFVSRGVYGEYLTELLYDSFKDGYDLANLEIIGDEADRKSVV